MLRVSKLAAQVARTGHKRPAEDLHLAVMKAIASKDVSLFNHQVDRALQLAEENALGAKDFSLFLNSVSKAKDVDASKLLTALRTKLLRNRRFVTSMVPTDIALMMLSTAKMAKSVPASITVAAPILKRLSGEIPLKLSLFEDHQLAQVLHAIASTAIDVRPIVDEIVCEIQTSRDISSFTAQSVVMIASALARIKPHDSDMVHDLWDSILQRASRIPRADMQPNWPDVLLSAAAFAGVQRSDACNRFLVVMADEVHYQFRSGEINNGRVSKALHALVQLNAKDHVTEKLRALC